MQKTEHEKDKARLQATMEDRLESATHKLESKVQGLRVRSGS